MFIESGLFDYISFKSFNLIRLVSLTRFNSYFLVTGFIKLKATMLINFYLNIANFINSVNALIAMSFVNLISTINMPHN